MIADGPNLFTMPKPAPAVEPELGLPATHRESPDAGNPEEAARQRVLELHEYSSGQVLDELRAAMRRLYARRRSIQGGEAFVTADDARLILDTDERYAHITNKNFMGSLFREKGWEKTGKIIKSKTAGSHANELKCWRWVTPEPQEDRKDNEQGC